MKKKGKESLFFSWPAASQALASIISLHSNKQVGLGHFLDVHDALDVQQEH